MYHASENAALRNAGFDRNNKAKIPDFGWVRPLCLQLRTLAPIDHGTNTMHNGRLPSGISYQKFDWLDALAK